MCSKIRLLSSSQVVLYENSFEYYIICTFVVECLDYSQVSVTFPLVPIRRSGLEVV